MLVKLTRGGGGETSEVFFLAEVFSCVFPSFSEKMNDLERCPKKHINALLFASGANPIK